MRLKKDEHIGFLQNVPLFAACSEKDLRTVGGLATEVDVPAGKTLMKEGAPGMEMFIVLQGSVEVTRNGQTISVIGPGEVVGELALLDHGPRTASVVTREPATLLVLDSRAFASLMVDAPAVAFKVAKTLAARLRTVQDSANH